MDRQPPELEPKFGMPRVYLEAPQDLPYEISSQLKALNEIFLSLRVINDWSKNRDRMKPEDIPILTQLWIDSSNLFYKAKNPEVFYELHKDDNKLIFQTIKDLHLKNENIIQQLFDKDIETFDSKRTVIKIKNYEHLMLLVAKIPRVLHDIGNPLTATLGFLDLAVIYPTHYENVDRLTLVLQKVMSAKYGLLLDNYPKEDISIQSLHGDIHESLVRLETSGVALEITDFTGSMNVNWSQVWLATLVENISQNAEKSYNSKGQILSKRKIFNKVIRRKKWSPIMKVDFKPIVVDGKNFMDILFEDNGVGFPQQIITKGFETGFTSWPAEGVKGTGIGMAAQQEAIKKYGGE